VVYFFVPPCMCMCVRRLYALKFDVKLYQSKCIVCEQLLRRPTISFHLTVCLLHNMATWLMLIPPLHVAM